MTNKKSQMEIMGLAIVIVLIIIGMLFIVRFGMVGKPAEFKSEFTKTQLATNTINAFLNSRTRDCFGMSVKELLRDCGQIESVQCDNGQKSCAYVNSTAQEIFSKTLDEWNKNYQFLVYFPNEEPIINLGEGCSGDKESDTFYVPTTALKLGVRLDICG